VFPKKDVSSFRIQTNPSCRVSFLTRQTGPGENCENICKKNVLDTRLFELKIRSTV